MNINRSHLIAIELIIIIGAISLFSIANSCGLGYTPVSYYYLRVHSQIQDQGLFNAPGLGTMPPMLPLIIGLVGEANMTVFNGLCLIGILVMIFLLSAQLNDARLRVLLLLITGGLTPLYLVSSFLWTEILFTLLLIAIYYLAYHSASSIRNTLLALFLLLLLPFLRYAAIFTIIPSVILIFLHSSRQKKQILAAVILSVSILFTIWILNFSEGFWVRLSDLLDPLIKLDIPFYVSNSKAFLSALGSILVPIVFGESILILVGLVIILVFFLLINKFWRYDHFKVEISLLCVFLFYYFSLHFVFPIEYDTADRYLTPMYPLLIIGGFRFIDHSFANWPLRTKKLLMIGTIIVASYGYIRTIKNVRFWNEIRCEQNNISHM